MRKWLVWTFMALLLSGCAAQEAMETVSDELAAPALAPQCQILVELPQEAASPAVESDSGRLYLCEGYEISIQTLESGNLDGTVRSVSGYGKDELTVMHTQQGECDRYDFVWACAGEGGDRIGRAAILDDGSYHYVLMVLGDAETAHANEPAWVRLFQTFELT